MFDKLDTDTPQVLTQEASANTTPVLSATLMQHQEEGLAWMLLRESKPDPTGEEGQSMAGLKLKLTLDLKVTLKFKMELESALELE